MRSDIFAGRRWCIERHFMPWNSKNSYLDGEAGTCLLSASVNSKICDIVDAIGTSRICMENIEKMSMVCIKFLSELDVDKLSDCNA